MDVNEHEVHNSIRRRVAAIRAMLDDLESFLDPSVRAEQLRVTDDLDRARWRAEWAVRDANKALLPFLSTGDRDEYQVTGSLLDRVQVKLGSRDPVILARVVDRSGWYPKTSWQLASGGETVNLAATGESPGEVILRWLEGYQPRAPWEAAA